MTSSWLNLPTGGHGCVICIGNLGRDFSQENTPDGHTETHNTSFISISTSKWEKWLSWMTNAFILWIYFEKFRKVMKQTEKVALSIDYSHVIKYKKHTHFKIKSNQTNRLTVNQLVNVLLAINKAHTVPRMTDLELIWFCYKYPWSIVDNYELKI